MVKKLISVVVIAAATVLTGFVAAQPAQAATCYGDYCSGQDPEATGCGADVQPAGAVRIPGTSAYIELRWSPACRTKWARTSWNGESPSTQLRAVQCATGYTQGYSGTNGAYWWTRMIYSPSLGVSAQWVGAPGSAGTPC